MITNCIRGDVFDTHLKHIVFAVNTQGNNDAGFAGKVASRVWPELANTGGNKLGDVLVHKSGGLTYHAIVCHSLKVNGWEQTPRIVRKSLDALKIPHGETIAVVLMGSGLAGMVLGADLQAIVRAIEECNKKVIVYML